MAMGFCALTNTVGAEPLELLIGGPGKDGVRKMIRTKDGGFVLAGWQDQKGIHESGTGLLVRLSSEGRLNWQKTLLTSGRNQLSTVLQREDGTYVAVLEEYPIGQDEGQVILVELDKDGQERSRHQVGGRGSDVADTIRETTDGGYMLAGESAVTGHKNMDAWVAKLSPEFNVVWEWRKGTAGRDRFNDLAVMPDGSSVAAGNSTSPAADGSLQEQVWLVKFDGQGNVLWSSKPSLDRAASIRGMTVNAEGEFIFSGFSKQPGTRIFDSWVGKAAADGSLVWEQSLPQGRAAFLHSVVALTPVRYIAAGAVRVGAEAGYDALAIEFDHDGSMVESRRHGGASSEQARFVLPTDDSSYVLAGSNTPVGTKNEQMWFYQYSAMGSE